MAFLEFDAWDLIFVFPKRARLPRGQTDNWGF